jgi:hypothetical protein
VYLHRLDNGEVVGVLHEEEGARRVMTIAVSKLSSGKGLSDGTDRSDATCLIVGDPEGVVRTWDLETMRCIARLHALEVTRFHTEIEIARDGGRAVTRKRRKSCCMCGTYPRMVRK